MHLLMHINNKICNACILLKSQYDKEFTKRTSFFSFLFVLAYDKQSNITADESKMHNFNHPRCLLQIEVHFPGIRKMRPVNNWNFRSKKKGKKVVKNIQANQIQYLMYDHVHVEWTSIDDTCTSILTWIRLNWN